MARATGGYRLLLAALLGLLSLRARPAQAAGRFELVWSAPAACPNGDDLKRRVERIVNRPLELADNEVLVVKATVSPPDDEGAWRVDVETDNGQHGRARTLAAASCDELANATAILVAILLEPPDPEPAPAGAPVPAKSDANATPSRSAVAAPARSPARFSLGAAGGVIGGTLPSWSPGLGVHGAFVWKALRSQLGAMFWLPAEKSVNAAGNQGADFSLVSAQARLCVQWAEHSLQPGLCGGADLALLRAKGFGPGVTPEVQHAKFVSISAGPALVWRHSERLSLLFDVAALLPLGSRRFVLTGTDPALVYSEALGVQLKCGAEFSL